MIDLIFQLAFQLQHIFFSIEFKPERIHRISLIPPALKITPVDVAERKYCLSYLPLACAYPAHVVVVGLIVVVHVTIIEIDVVRVGCAVLGTRPIVAEFLSIQFMAHFLNLFGSRNRILQDTTACFLIPATTFVIPAKAGIHFKAMKRSDRRPVTSARSRSYFFRTLILAL